MLLIYLLGLINVFRAQSDPLTRMSAEPLVHHPGWSMRGALVVLALATIGVVWLSEMLVAQVEPVVEAWGVSEFFLGVILVPLIGNVSEHMVAVTVALKKQMSLSMEIAVGSSLQIALFVVPFLVFISLLLGNPLTLVFNPFELIALVGAGAHRHAGSAGRRGQLAGRRRADHVVPDSGAGLLLPPLRPSCPRAARASGWRTLGLWILLGAVLGCVLLGALLLGSRLSAGGIPAGAPALTVIPQPTVTTTPTASPTLLPTAQATDQPPGTTSGGDGGERYAGGSCGDRRRRLAAPSGAWPAICNQPGGR